MIRLDVGCGDQRREGFEGIDKHDFSASYPDGRFQVHDIKDPLPYDDESIDEIWCHHVFEHLTHRHPDRDMDYLIWVMNEFHRVLKTGSRAHLIVPWVDHPNAWRHPTHYRYFNQWSFEFWWYSVDKMAGEIATTERHGRWGMERNRIEDNCHIYAIMVRLAEWP